jgi:hypothetical protein
MLTLHELFDLQDCAATQHRADPQVSELLGLLDDAIQCITALLERSVPGDERQTVIRVLGTDCVSGLVTSARLSLWGLVPESASLLRSVHESAAILDVIVREQAYMAAANELQAKRLKRFAYDAIIQRLPDLHVSIAQRHGRLSNLGSHVSGVRLAFSSYQIGGEYFDRLGYSLSPAAIPELIRLALPVALQLATAICEAHTQAGLAPSEVSSISALSQRLLGLPEIAV